MHEQSHDRRERLHLRHLVRCEHRGQCGQLLHSHREGVGADAADTVQEHHAWRSGGIVQRAKVAAKDQVLEERPIRVFRVEVALLLHEGKQLGVGIILQPQLGMERLV